MTVLIVGKIGIRLPSKRAAARRSDMLPASTRLAIGKPWRSVSTTTRNPGTRRTVGRGRVTVSHNGKDLRNLPIEERRRSGRGIPFFRLKILNSSPRRFSYDPRNNKPYYPTLQSLRCRSVLKSSHGVHPDTRNLYRARYFPRGLRCRLREIDGSAGSRISRPKASDPSIRHEHDMITSKGTRRLLTE